MSIPADQEVRSELRRPVNAYQQLDNSIHNDSVARPLGLRGGTVAGSVHMDQFPPYLVEVFGEGWFESGSLSLSFKNATVDQEPVAVVIRRPAADHDVQTEVSVEREDGLLVATGTASVGDAGQPSHLHSVDLRACEPAQLRMFSSLNVGDQLVSHTSVGASDEARQRQESGLITEPLGWYVGDSPWGGPVVCPAMLVRMLYRPTSEHVSKLSGGAVGLFGAIEIRHIAGPVFADTEYDVETTVVAVGESPKTEYLWFDSVAKTGGEPVASMRMQLRYMKQSSRHYQAG